MERDVGEGAPDRRTLEYRRAERELFFWTVRQSLYLVMLVAASVYSVLSLLNGEPPGVELIRALR